MMELRQPNDNQRSIRLRLYQGAQDMRKAIEDIDADAGVKRELGNSLTALLRLALQISDGHLSPEELRPW